MRSLGEMFEYSSVGRWIYEGDEASAARRADPGNLCNYAAAPDAPGRPAGWSQSTPRAAGAHRKAGPPRPAPGIALSGQFARTSAF
jgi:hypothetical protein